jgi:nitrate reductase gamma subunit
MKTTFLFELWPYIAVATFGVGMMVRYVLAPKPHNDVFAPSRILRSSLLLLFLGHLAGILFPQQILVWNSMPFRLYVLESVALVSGVAALVGWVRIVLRHLRRSYGSLWRQIADTLFIAALFVALLSGSLIAVLYRWGSSWGVLTLGPYTLSLLKGRPAVGLVADMPLLVRLHVVSAFASFTVFPATGLCAVVIAALNHGSHLIAPPVSNMVGSASRLFNIAGRRLNPAIWIWPEED